MSNPMTKFASVACTFLICVTAWTSSSIGQELTTVKQVVELHLKQLGGRKKLETIKAVSNETTMLIVTGPSNEIETSMNLWQKGNKFLTVMELPNGDELRQGSNGEHYWTINPFQGANLMDANEKGLAHQQFSSPFPSLGWSDNYDGKIEFHGTDKVDDDSCYKLIFTPKTGKPTTRFFDVKSGRLLKFETVQMGPGGEMEISVYHSDFKDVDGITIPHKQVTSTPQFDITIETDSIKFNTEIDDSKFEIPDEIKKLIADLDDK